MVVQGTRVARAQAVVVIVDDVAVVAIVVRIGASSTFTQLGGILIFAIAFEGFAIGER